MNETFENGAIRKEKRLRYDLIPREILDGIAERFTIGADKYGANQWKLGGEKFFTDAKNHAQHHFLCYLNGELEDEKELTDHLKAALWNLGVVLWWEHGDKSSSQPPTKSL